MCGGSTRLGKANRGRQAIKKIRGGKGDRGALVTAGPNSVTLSRPTGARRAGGTHQTRAGEQGHGRGRQNGRLDGQGVRSAKTQKQQKDDEKRGKKKTGPSEDKVQTPPQQAFEAAEMILVRKATRVPKGVPAHGPEKTGNAVG